MRSNWFVVAVLMSVATCALGQSGSDKPQARAVKTTASGSGEVGEIRIGQSIHLSGPLAASAQGVLKGQNLAIEEVNRQGGVNGRPVRLITLDDAFDPKRCVENVHTLIDKENVVALTGIGSATNVSAVLPVLLEKKVPLIGVYTGSPTVRSKPHPYLFTTTASYREELGQMVRTLVTQHRTKIAVVYQSPQLLPVVEEAIKSNGATLVASQIIAPNGSDAVAAVQTLAAGKPEALVVMTSGPGFAAFVKAARSYIGVPIYAISLANSQVIVQAMGDDARGVAFTSVVPYPWRQTTPLTKDFAAVMERAKLPVDYDHMLGYLNMRIVLEGLRRAGKQVTPQTLTRSMEGMARANIGGFPLSYSSQNHHGSNFVEILIVGPGGRYLR